MPKKKDDEEKKDIGIYELTKAVRRELLRLMDDPETKNRPIMDLKELNLELNVSITKIGEGEVRLLILSLGGKVQKQVTDIIKLKFKPRGVISTVQ